MVMIGNTHNRITGMRKKRPDYSIPGTEILYKVLPNRCDFGARHHHLHY